MASYLALNLHGFVATQPVGSVDRGIAEYILDHLEEMAGMTSGELARACAVSRPTVSRFIRALGYADYAAFQRACILWQRDAGEHFGVGGHLGETTCPTVATYLAGARRSLGAVEAGLDMDTLTEAAAAIVSARRRLVMGSMQAGDVASMFHHDVFQAGLAAQVLVAPTDQRAALGHLEDDTCVVIFSELGTFFARVDVDELLSARPASARIVLVTTAPDGTPLNHPSVDYIVRCSSGPAIWSSGLTLVVLSHLLALTCRNMRNDAPSCSLS